jgi:hypothetical protein
MNKKQGWGETQAKSDGTFPSDGSHLVTQEAKTNPAGSEKGGRTTACCGAQRRARCLGTGIGAPVNHGADQAGSTNIGRPTVGETGEFRNAEDRTPTDRTKSPNNEAADPIWSVTF